MTESFKWGLQDIYGSYRLVFGDNYGWYAILIYPSHCKYFPPRNSEETREKGYLRRGGDYD